MIVPIHKKDISPVVPFEAGKDTLLLMDFTAANTTLTDAMISDVTLLRAYVNVTLLAAGARYGIGGYQEPRVLYRRSALFTGTSATAEEPRSIHLGIDIWAVAGTPVYAPLDGVVHSFAFNNQPGDYGATIILQHTVDGVVFHTLYGHLSLADLNGLHKGKVVKGGSLLAHFGNLPENGNWPPHLHFQVIIDMEGMEGDYPGVCRPSEKAQYIANCPDPDLLLRMMQYAVIFIK